MHMKPILSPQPLPEQQQLDPQTLPFEDKAQLAEQHPKVVAWLLNYKEDFPFYLSVRDQMMAKGRLSDKQIEAIYKAIDRDAKAKPQQAAPKPAKQYSIAPGDIIELKAWIAKRIQEEKALPVAYRNMEITEVLGETAAAYHC